MMRLLWAVLAVIAEALSLWLLDQPTELDSLAAYFALHGLASALSSWRVWLLLPATFRTPALPAFVLLYGLAFFIPVLGVVTMAVAAQLASRFPKALYVERYSAMHMPQFLEVQHEAPGRSDLRASDARRVLGDPTQPLDDRLRVLVALQHMRPKAVVPLMRSLLADPADDVRLLAYTMLDTWEKELTLQVRQTLLDLEAARQAEDTAAIASALRRLAELHWQQADSGLARGDLRTFALERAKEYCEQTLQADSFSPGVWQLYANVLIALNSLGAASRALELARKVRLPEREVWPLMAQVAYEKRDYITVRKLMRRMGEPSQLPAGLRGVAAFWQRRRVAGVDVHV